MEGPNEKKENWLQRRGTDSMIWRLYYVQENFLEDSDLKPQRMVKTMSHGGNVYMHVIVFGQICTLLVLAKVTALVRSVCFSYAKSRKS